MARSSPYGYASGDEPLSIGQCALLACLLEVTAPKPGNVHRGADFDDLTYGDFLLSAAAIAPVMETAPGRPLGETVLAAVRATRRMVSTNSNLGMVLLLAPLASVPRETPLAAGVRDVLAHLQTCDAERVYEAIRLAQPGGLGEVSQEDVARSPTVPLVEAMRLAAERDRIARQYAHRFEDVFESVVPYLVEADQAGYPLLEGIVWVQLRLLQQFPDSLIVRKCGPTVGREASDRAAEVLSSGSPGDEGYLRALADFDFWLRSDGRRRNPGATADLIAAGLFVMLREEQYKMPLRWCRLEA